MNDPYTSELIYFDPCSLYQRSPHDRFLSYTAGRENDSSIIYLRKNIYAKASYTNKLLYQDVVTAVLMLCTSEHQVPVFQIRIRQISN
jgi:hypothetical protein